VGGGINRGAGGKNAPSTTRNQDGLPKMRNGWFAHKETQVLTEQVMHRNVLDTDSQLCKDSCNADGTTHKGHFEILQERGDDCIAVDEKPMTKHAASNGNVHSILQQISYVIVVSAAAWRTHCDGNRIMPRKKAN
jgi:hypothetical protein